MPIALVGVHGVSRGRSAQLSIVQLGNRLGRADYWRFSPFGVRRRGSGENRSSPARAGAPSMTPWQIAGRCTLETEALLSIPGMDRISRTDGSAFTRRGEAWSEATQLGSSSFRVRLGGPFRGAWLANLSSRLAAFQISIDHVHARFTADYIWIAELHLLGLGQRQGPLAIDYVALAEETDISTKSAFAIDSYRLLGSRDYGGTLMLTLEAPDSLGLLGSLLTRLALLGLVPIELHIETKGGRAFDSLWLCAAGGGPPPSEAHDAVAQVLDRSCHGASSVAATATIKR